MSENYSLELLWSKNKKYKIHLLQTYEYAGKKYYSLHIFTPIRNYFQHVAAGVNFSQAALEEYVEERV